MVDSANNKETSEQGKVRRRETSPLQKAIVTILWSLIGLSLVSYWYVSSMMAVTVVAVVCMLAGYCRKRYQAHMLPSSFIARLSRSELYQIYVVRAVQRPGSQLLLFVAFLASVLTVAYGVISLNPVVKLEEMESKTGSIINVVERQRLGSRRSCGDRVYLETGGDTIIEYNGLLSGDTLSLFRNGTTKDVTIWSRRSIQLPPCAVMDWISQVQIGTQIVERYDINSRKEANERHKRWRVIWPTIGALAFLGIWLADRRAKNQQS